MTAVRLMAMSAGCGRRRVECLRAAAFAVAMNAAGTVCAAGSYTNSASGNWDADASWTEGKPAAGGASDAVIVFNGTGAVASTNNLTGTFFLNRMDFISGAATLSGNALAFTNNGAAGPQVSNTGGAPVALKNGIVLGSDTTFYAGNTITNFGALSGKRGLVKTGEGTLFFATNSLGALSYSGTTLVSSGTLVVGTFSSRTSASSTNVTVQGGATLNILSGVGVNGFTLPGTAAVNVQSNATLTTDVPTISCGTLAAASGATINGVSGCLSLHATDAAGSAVATLGSLNLKRIILEPYSGANPVQTVRFDGTGTGLIIGTDSGTAFSLRPGSASGLLSYVMDIADSSAANVDLLVPFINFRTSSGGIAFVKQGAGVMQVNGLDWSSASYPTKPVSCDVAAGSLIWNVSVTNAVGVNFADVTVENGGTLQVGTNGLSGAIYVGVADNGTLAFSRSDACIFTNAISGSGIVVQKGTGTLTLSGPNTYSGGTTVSSGTLLVNAPGYLSGGDVTVAGGSLGGNGTIGGPVGLSNGCALVPGGSNTVGTLTLSDAGSSALALNGSMLRLDLSNVAGTCDQVAVAGTLVLNEANTIALSFPDGTPPAGTYTLMTYAAKSGSGTLALDKMYPNTTLNVGETDVTLTVTGEGIAYLTWTGNVSGMWDTSTINWALEGVSSVYADGDSVLFDDTASGNYTVSAAGSVSPSGVTFNNSAVNYTLSADIAGTENVLIKTGSGKTTLSGSNTYGGGTILSAGTLSVSSAANLSSAGPLTFNGGILQIVGTSLNSLAPYAVNWNTFNGGLDIASGNTMTVTNAIGGFGSLAKAGAGTLVLAGTNTYSGGTTSSAGYLQVNNSDALGSGPVNMTGGNCELDLMGGLVFTNAITVRGVGVVNSAGSLQSYYGTSNTWNGPVTLGEGNARLGAPDAILVIGGIIDSGANVYDLVVRNPNGTGGTVVLAATNAWRGNLWIRCGTVKLGTHQAVPVSSVLNLGLAASQTGVTNSTFDLAGFDQEVAGVVDRGTDNAHDVTCSASTFSTLTVNNPSTAYTYAGSLSGNLDMVKAGNGTLTLSGTNTTFGSFTVSAGTLVVDSAGTLGYNSTNIVVNAGTLSLSNSVCIADNATLQIANGGAAKVSLAAGVNESVGHLWFGDKMMTGGTYGATGSGATVTDDEHFAGSGILTVRYGSGGTLIRLL